MLANQISIALIITAMALILVAVLAPEFSLLVLIRISEALIWSWLRLKRKLEKQP